MVLKILGVKMSFPLKNKIKSKHSMKWLSHHFCSLLGQEQESNAEKTAMAWTKKNEGRGANRSTSQDK